jgi:hypothetical protein
VWQPDLNYLKIIAASCDEAVNNPGNTIFNLSFVSTTNSTDPNKIRDKDGNYRDIHPDDKLIIWATYTNSAGTAVEFVAFVGMVKEYTKEKIVHKLKLMLVLGYLLEATFSAGTLVSTVGADKYTVMSDVASQENLMGCPPSGATCYVIDYSDNADQRPALPAFTFQNNTVWDAMKKVNLITQVANPSNPVPQQVLLMDTTTNGRYAAKVARTEYYNGYIDMPIALMPLGDTNSSITIDKSKLTKAVVWMNTTEDIVNDVRGVFAKEVLISSDTASKSTYGSKSITLNVPECDFLGSTGFTTDPANKIMTRSVLTAYKDPHVLCEVSTLFQHVAYSGMEDKPRHILNVRYNLDDTHTGGSGKTYTGLTCIRYKLDYMTGIVVMTLADYVPLSDYVSDIQDRTSSIENILDPSRGVPSNRGGTGQTAFAKGDLLVGNAAGDGLAKYTIGNAGEFLKVVSGTIDWVALTPSDVTWSGDVIPNADQRDLGSATNRWDVFAYNLNVYGTFTPSGNIIGASDGLDLGSGTYKWDLFTNTATVYTKLAASSNQKPLGDSTNQFTAHLYDATIYNSIVPTTTNTKDCGSSALSWRSIYADTSVILNESCVLTPTATYNCLKVTSTNGWVEIAPRSATYCHFYTGATYYYFDHTIHLDGNLRPYTTGNDLGDATYRWDAYLTDVNINGSITGTLIPATTGTDLGSTSYRWDAYLGTVNTSGVTTFGEDATISTNNVYAFGALDKRWLAGYFTTVDCASLKPQIYNRTVVCDSASTTSPYTIVGDSGTCSSASTTSPYTITSSAAFGNVNVYDYLCINANRYQVATKTDSSNITATLISGTNGSWSSQTFYIALNWYARKGSVLDGSNGNTYTITSITNDYTAVANLTTGTNGAFTNVTMTFPTIDAFVSVPQTNPSASWLRFRHGSSSQHSGVLFSDYDASHFFLHARSSALQVTYSQYKMDSYLSTESPIAGSGTRLLYLNTSGDLTLLGSSYAEHHIATPVVASDTLKISNDNERSTGSSSYTKLKEIRILAPLLGTIRVKVEYKSSSALASAYQQIYINGVAVAGTEYNTNSTTYATTTEDVTVSLVPGDLVQIYGKNLTSYSTSVQNFRIYFDLATTPTAPGDSTSGY